MDLGRFGAVQDARIASGDQVLHSALELPGLLLPSKASKLCFNCLMETEHFLNGEKVHWFHYCLIWGFSVKFFVQF